MDHAVKQLMMVGLPSSGKTTFLAAFWYMVDQVSAGCSLTVDKLEGERKYLNQIRDAWLEYKPVPRNLVDTQKMVAMHLKSTVNSDRVVLKIPDLSGEMYRQQWSKRQLTIGYDNFLKTSQGALLFIGPDVVKAHRIDMLDDLSGMVAGAAGADQTASQKDWDIEKAPTQIQLIELLQTIAVREYIKPAFKLAVVVSAYDLHRSTYPEPADFVARELPMLGQFLASNADQFMVAIFGVSAQGGVYASPLLLPEMLKHFKELAGALTKPSGEVQTWIANAIDPATIEALRNTDNEEQARELLVKDLNVLLGRKDFYDVSRFAATNLKAETKILIEDLMEKEAQDSTEVKMLNRRLLEDVFPRNVSREWQYRKEHKMLVDLPASHRVVVCGKAIKNEHDITEPIQWLMT
jgi:hypothetical protein